MHEVPWADRTDHLRQPEGTVLGIGVACGTDKGKRTQQVKCGMFCERAVVMTTAVELDWQGVL